MSSLDPINIDVGAHFDAQGFDRFDRAVREARTEAKKDVNAHLGGKYDSRGVESYKRGMDSARHASDTFRDSQGRLHDATGRYVSETRAATSATDRHSASAKRSSLGLAGMAGNARLLAGSAGIGAVVLGLKEMISEQSDAQASAAQLDAVLKSTGGTAGITRKQIEGMAQSLSQKVAVDDEAIQSASALMLTFTGVKNAAGAGNDVFSQSITASLDLSRAFGKDLNSSAIMVGKALNDPVKGMTALSRVGVSFTAGQKEQVKSLVASGKTMEAQKLILGELRKETGGSAEAYGKTLPGAIDRAKVSFSNLAENLGGKLAPAAAATAGFLSDLMDGKGKGSGGGMAAQVKQTLSQLGNSQAVKGLVDGLQSLWGAVKRVAGEVGKQLRNLFGGKNGAGVKRDLGQISGFIGNVFRGVGIIIGGSLKVLTPLLTGFVKVVRGAFKIIAGIVTLDFGKVFGGLKDIVGASFGAIFGVLGRALGLVGRLLGAIFRPVGRVFASAWNGARHAVSAGVNGIVSIVTGAPGRLLSLVGRFASAGSSLGHSFINAIGNGLRSAGNFLSNIGRSVANWINDHTPFGDTISLGPISVKLPALAQGGKVGPSTGGARLYVAGEGGKDEWVISQEGDRQQNIGYALEALSALGVNAYKKGGKVSKVNPITGKVEKHTAKDWGKLDKQARALVNAGRPYAGAVDTGEEADLNLARFETINDAHLAAAIQGWHRQPWGGLLGALRTRLEILWNTYGSRNARLQRVRRDLTGKDWGKRVRAGAVVKQLTSDTTDARTSATQAYSAIMSALEDQGTSSADEVAALAEKQIAAFESARADQFGSFGRNFVAAGGTASPFAGVAGARYWGAGTGGAAGGRAASGASVTITNNFQQPPPDAHLWSRAVGYDLKAVL